MINKRIWQTNHCLFATSIKRSGSRLLMMVLGVSMAAILLIVIGRSVNSADAANPQTTFTVTTNADTDDGSCDSHCTLREAINMANNLPAPDIIVFDVSPFSQTITLSSGLPIITDSLTIDGSAIPSLTISGNDLYRIFEIFPGSNLTLTHMNIISGFHPGGGAGIRNSEGVLTINHVAFIGNRGGNIVSSGGGILSVDGSVFVYNSVFINNSAKSDGGGISNAFGNLVVKDSYFRGNTGGGAGGGISSWSDVETIVNNSIFIENEADNGGGIGSRGILTLTHSTFIHNSANVNGGGLETDAQAVISYTTFLSNTAGHHGGAISSGHSLLLTNSTLSDNTAVQYGGAIVNYSEFYSATITATNSLFQGNMAGYGGGIANWTGYKVAVSNSTLSGNTAITAGGGISNSMMLELNNVTISDNEAATGGGLASNGTMTMSNSIVANSVGGDCANSGLFNTNVHNLVEDGSCNPLLSGDPLLGLLADNGGATWTQALLPGSPALDTGDNVTCELTDQRGTVRPIDGNGDGTAVCDIGAVEQATFWIYLPIVLTEG